MSTSRAFSFIATSSSTGTLPEKHAVLPAGALQALAEDREKAAVGVDHRQPDGSVLVAHRAFPSTVPGVRLGDRFTRATR